MLQNYKQIFKKKKKSHFCCDEWGKGVGEGGAFMTASCLHPLFLGEWEINFRFSRMNLT